MNLYCRKTIMLIAEQRTKRRIVLMQDDQLREIFLVKKQCVHQLRG